MNRVVVLGLVEAHEGQFDHLDVRDIRVVHVRSRDASSGTGEYTVVVDGSHVTQAVVYPIVVSDGLGMARTV